MRRRTGTLPLPPVESGGGGWERNPFASVASTKADAVFNLVREERPEVDREHVLDLLVARWGVRRQVELLRTAYPDQLADRVLLMLGRRERE
jgi:hypothetical protein